MAVVNLDKNGCLINVVGAQSAGQITFNYHYNYKNPNNRPISGIFIGGEAAVTILYDYNNNITGIFPGKAVNKVIVNIG